MFFEKVMMFKHLFSFLLPFLVTIACLWLVYTETFIGCCSYYSFIYVRLYTYAKIMFLCFCSIICGLTQYTKKAHIARAALEAVCFQTREVIICHAVLWQTGSYGENTYAVKCTSEKPQYRKLHICSLLSDTFIVYLLKF